MKRKYSVAVVLLVTISLFFIINNSEKSKYSIKTFQVEQGWGYSIFNENKLIIRQALVPSIQEKKHFKSENDAFNCGKIVLKKLEKSKIPSVTLKELQQNNIHL